AWGRDHRGLQAIAERVAPRKQRGPRGGAHRLNIKLFKASPIVREFVDVRRFDIGAVKADVFPAKVIGYDVDDVRSRRRLLGACRTYRQSQRHQPCQEQKFTTLHSFPQKVNRDIVPTGTRPVKSTPDVRIEATGGWWRCPCRWTSSGDT